MCTYQDLRCTDQNDPGGGIHHQQVLLQQGYKLKKKKHNTKSVFMNETATSAVSLKSVNILVQFPFALPTVGYLIM